MKQRLDVRMTEAGLAESRQKAQALILAGEVSVNGKRVDKPGAQVDNDAEITVKQALAYVSRGGLKLEKAMQCFPISLTGAVCADIGASTGGFTDCMLQRGAAKVYAVDVGYGQLAWKLRTDSRVVCLERTNARYLSREEIPEPLDFASVDVSFISLKLILPPLRSLLRDSESRVVCLIKPQFEVGRGKVGKKGVVRDRAVHREVLENFLVNASGAGFAVDGLTWSPIRGPEGNIEYLGFLRPAPNALLDGVAAPDISSDAMPAPDGASVPHGVSPDGASVPHGVSPDGASVPHGVSPDGASIPHGVSIDGASVPHGVSIDDIPALVAASHDALDA